MNGVTSTWGPDGQSAVPNAHASNMLRRWLVGYCRLGDVQNALSEAPLRRHVSLVVNNECNLSCAHCFHQLPSLAHNRLTQEEWGAVLDSSLGADIGQYVIAGKEAFVGKTGLRVLDWLGEMRRAHPCVRTGLITNGTLLHKHTEAVSAANLSHMDISLDGCEREHDAIRGDGAFAKTKDNVRWAAGTLKDRLFVTLTLQKRNVGRIGEALMAFAELGVTRVGISPFEKLPYNDDLLALSKDDLGRFFGGLRELASLEFPHPMFVQVDACIVEPLAMFSFIESEWFDVDAIHLDGTGFLYCRHTLANGVVLSFRFLPWPMKPGCSVRISADGDLLCVEDARHPRTYHLNALANLRDFGLDFPSAFITAKKHPRAAQIDVKYASCFEPHIREAFKRRAAR